MEERNKKVTIFQKFKKIWKNPRYKAFIELAFFFVFFTVILANVRIQNQRYMGQEKDDVTQTEQNALFAPIDNYTFSHHVVALGEIPIDSMMHGVRYGKKQIIDYSSKTVNASFYMEEMDLYQAYGKELTKIERAVSDLNFIWKLQPNRMDEILKKAITNTPIKIENGTKIIYEILLTDFITALENEELPPKIEDSNRIKMSVSKYENGDVEIVLNVNPFMNMNQITYTSYEITLMYQNIGQVKGLNVQYKLPLAE